MMTRIILLAVALLASAVVQARTPYEGAANDRIARAFRAELPALPSATGLWQTPPPASQLAGEEALELDQFPAEPLSLDPLPARRSAAAAPTTQQAPRHAINWALGMASSTQGTGALMSLGYAYRLKGIFWIGGIVQYELRNLVYDTQEIKLLEMNYWELPLFRWLALRVGAGVGMAIYQSDRHNYGAVMGRIMIQWVVRLGKVASLTFSPILMGPSCLDIGYSPISHNYLEESCDMLQFGLSFRF